MPDTDGEPTVVRVMNNLLNNLDHVETTILYETLIPILVRDSGFFDGKGKVLNIDKVLEQNFIYARIDENEHRYGWKKR